MRSFNDTFKDRIDHWVSQLVAGAKYDEISASGEDALKVQKIIEAAIESWNTGLIVEL